MLPSLQAMCKKSLEMVALKVYHMENLCELNHYQVFREIRVHQSLQHQNIVHLFASFQVRAASCSPRQPSCVCMPMPASIQAACMNLYMYACFVNRSHAGLH